MSNETKFTPGNWETFIQPGSNGLETTINVGSKRIATLSHVGIEETKANANLITSAKSMYEALKAAHQMITSICGDFVPHGLVVIENALQKAEGKPL